jgi:hypothetical protein
MMNYIRHLNTFLFNYVKRDKRLTANHVSLYLSLFQYWNYHRFQNPFFIRREEVISITGIGSKNTYLKCIKDLHQFGYIFYSPSKNKFQRSKIQIARLDGMKENLLKQLELFESENQPESAAGEPVSTEPKSGTVSVPDLVPYVSQNCDRTGLKCDPDTGSNMGLLIKHKHINKREEENSPAQNIFFKNENFQNAVNGLGAEQKMSRPEITQVLSFFKKNNYPDIEAKKFFNHYQSNGWLIGGSAPMSDWYSSAHKWMLNAQKFDTASTPKNPNNSSAKTDLNNNKDFSEPL